MKEVVNRQKKKISAGRGEYIAEYVCHFTSKYSNYFGKLTRSVCWYG